MTNLTRLYLLRHGEVEPAYQRVFGGRIDMNLSPGGQEQARALAEYLQNIPLHAVYASPMQRVRQTLAPYTELTGRPVEFVEGFREVDFGDWTGLSFAAVLERYGVTAYTWLDQLTSGQMPNAESAAAFRHRLEAPLRQIQQRHAGQSVAVFCHGGVVRGLLSILCDLPLHKMARFEVDYASLTCVEISPRGADIRLLNFTPWRDLSVEVCIATQKS
jgi:broad specificity phosphatase PhoE